MEHLFCSLKCILPTIQKNRHCLLCLDYDGTLTPIVDRPELAVLSEEVRETVGCLARTPFFKLAIISGRSLSDIQRRVGIQGLFYVGNHGLEILHPNGKGVSLIPSNSQRALERVREVALQGKIDSLRGVLIEDKGAILAFHYRQTPPADQAALKSILLEVEGKYYDTLELTYGKMVMEIRPRCTINKGSAVSYLRERVGMGAFPIYIGDDLTDADAFQVLKGEGLTIQIGQSELPTNGDYYLRDPGEVLGFLRRLRENFGQMGWTTA